MTQSSARAKSRIIPESVTLSDSEDDLRFDARRDRLVSSGASKSPAASTTFQLVQMSQAVPVTTNKNVSAPTSSEKPGPLCTSAALLPFGTQVLFKLNTKANHITVPHPYDHKHIDDDMPALVHSSLEKGICDGHTS